jgi:hypothetical protein
MRTVVQTLMAIVGTLGLSATLFAQQPILQRPPGITPNPPTLGPRLMLHSVGGGFSMIAGSGLVLQINGGTPITINSNAPFTFPVGFVPNATYDVEVRIQPPGQNCRLTNNRGTITSGNVTNVSVACLLTGNAYQVSYLVTGLVGSGLLLTDGFALGAAANGQPVAFGNPLAEGSQYAISVVTQPSNPGQTCIVIANGSGTVSRSSITNPAQIACR